MCVSQDAWPLKARLSEAEPEQHHLCLFGAWGSDSLKEACVGLPCWGHVDIQGRANLGFAAALWTCCQRVTKCWLALQPRMCLQTYAGNLLTAAAWKKCLQLSSEEPSREIRMLELSEKWTYFLSSVPSSSSHDMALPQFFVGMNLSAPWHYLYMDKQTHVLQLPKYCWYTFACTGDKASQKGGS